MHLLLGMTSLVEAFRNWLLVGRTMGLQYRVSFSAGIKAKLKTAIEIGI